MTDTIDVFLDDIKCALQRFEPKPCDVFVITIPGEVSEEQATRIWQQWKEHVPYDVKVVVLVGGMTVEMVSSQGLVVPLSHETTS